MLMTIKRPKRDNLKSSYSWHCRLGPACERRMTELHNFGSLGSFGCESFDNCESCLLGKDDPVALYGKGEHYYGPLDLKHSDVYGSLFINSKGGFVYFITFIDDCSCFRYLYLTRYKSESFEKFRAFRNETKKKLGRSFQIT